MLAGAFVSWFLHVYVNTVVNPDVDILGGGGKKG